MRLLPAAACLALTVCAQGVPPPASLDTRNEACGWCRMAVSEARFAAQLVAPGEEPKFFDDVGCLRDYLRDSRKLPERAAAYVTDHRTKAWVPAHTAIYTRVPSVQTPMGSHLMAHADSGSRAADPRSAGGEPLSATDLFGPYGPPRGTADSGSGR